MPRLDGFDEVAAERGSGCAQAIGSLGVTTAPYVPIVVYCRTREHQQLSAKLDLRGTLAVGPMNNEQVTEFLSHDAEQFAEAWTRWHASRPFACDRSARNRSHGRLRDGEGSRPSVTVDLREGVLDSPDLYGLQSICKVTTHNAQNSPVCSYRVHM